MNDDDGMFNDYEVTTSFVVGIDRDDLDELKREGRVEVPGRAEYDRIVVEVCDE